MPCFLAGHFCVKKYRTLNSGLAFDILNIIIQLTPHNLAFILNELILQKDIYLHEKSNFTLHIRTRYYQ